MSRERSVEIALLAAIAERGPSGEGLNLAGEDGSAVLGRLARAGVRGEDATAALYRLRARQMVTASTDGRRLLLLPAGADALLDVYGELATALDPSPDTPAQEDCPSLPWLTTVQTEWIEALSLNYAVDPAAVAALLPWPLQPEVFHGRAWVQVLLSSLREMRPQGAPALFGVNFYQVSYRAAVCFTDLHGQTRRGGYFVRSETNDPLMRAIGNHLAEFKFHEFGLAEMVVVRQGPHLTFGVEPGSDHPGGRLAGVVDTTPLDGPPARSRWSSLAELQEPLVDCFDAFGVDTGGGWLYTLTIDRDPWRCRFVRPVDLYCEHFADGPLAGTAELDSVLHIARCPYRWRPLRRERLPGGQPVAG